MLESISCRRSIDRSIVVPELTTRPPFCERSLPALVTKPFLLSSCRIDNADGSYRSSRWTNSHDFMAGDPDFTQAMHFSSMDFGENLNVSTLSHNPGDPGSPLSGAQCEVESEMWRLKLELKQTMDMYNTACNEAINAKQHLEVLGRAAVAGSGERVLVQVFYFQ